MASARPAGRNNLILLVGTSFGVVLALALLNLLSTTRTALLAQSRDRLLHATAALKESVSEQTAVMRGLAMGIKNDPQFIRQLRERDRAALFAKFSELYKIWHDDHHLVSNFYFLDPDGKVILRVHEPQKFGDTISRYSFTRSRERLTWAEEIENGAHGFLVHRVVKPVLDHGELIGFIELGSDVDWKLGLLGQKLDIGFVILTPEERERLGAEVSEIASNGHLSWLVPLQLEGRQPRSYVKLTAPVPPVRMALLGSTPYFILAYLLFTLVLIRAVQLISSDVEKKQAATFFASRLSSLGEMAAGIAHEINNPLAIIEGRVASLRGDIEDGVEPEHYEPHLAAIEKTVARITKIIRGLRAFAMDGEHEPLVETELRAVIAETLDLCRARFRHGGVEIRLNVADCLKVNCAPTQISQVLLNLMNNAYDALEGCGEKWVELEAVETGNRVELRITDSGAGIPGKVRERLTEPFFTTKGPGKGTGLGLSISRRIIERHGGEFFLDRRSRRTCFVIRLPRASGDLKAAA